MLRAHNVKKAFSQHHEQKTILQSCSLTIERGTTYALTGMSGSGKSTFMHILAGFDEPTDGIVQCDGRALSTLTSLERAQLLAFVPQHPFFIKELTVLENIMLAGEIACLPVDKILYNAQFFIAEFGLQGLEHAYVAELSGGQQQRAALARALVVEPHCLLADEPTGSLDDATGLQLMQTVLRCVKEWNMSLVISTHNEALARMMDVVFLLKHGILEPVMTRHHDKGITYDYGTR